MNTLTIQQSETFLIYDERNTGRKKSVLLLLSFFVLGMLATVLEMQNGLKMISLVIALTYLCMMLFLKEENAFMLLCFLLPCSSLFDNAGFKYLLNFSIFIFFFRFILLENPFRKREFYYALFFLILDLCLLFLKGIFSFSFLLGSGSSFISYSLLILYMKRKTDYEINPSFFYIAFFIGVLFSTLSGFLQSKYAISDLFHIRQIGLTRDANYLALFCLLGFFAYDMFFEKGFTFLAWIIKGGFALCGLLTMSKMFLLMIVVGFLFWIIINFKKLSEHPAFIAALILFAIVLLGFIYLGAFDSLFETYLNRFKGGDITTGRIYIAQQFLIQSSKSPIDLLFGASTGYFDYYNVVYNAEHMYLHCTYLEVIIAYGCVGGVLFYAFFFKILRDFRHSLMTAERRGYLFPLIIFLIGIAALPMLTSDLTPLSLLFLLGSYKAKNQKKEDLRTLITVLEEENEL
jgi:hypothetical protein